MEQTSKNSRILIVEDEENLAIGLEYNLKREGYRVTRAEDGRKALTLFKKNEFDLIVLDIMLPYIDGFKVASKIREWSPQIPILMLTARTAAKDRVKGLEIGADDYLTKPFHLEEFLLRIHGMLKRKQWYQSVLGDDPIYRLGDNEIDFDTMRCTNGKHRFQITPLEAMILKYFIHHKGKIVTRKDLLKDVWNMSSEIETRTIDNFMMRLRKYFEPSPSSPIYFKSVRGAGYVFNDE